MRNTFPLDIFMSELRFCCEKRDELCELNLEVKICALTLNRVWWGLTLNRPYCDWCGRIE